MEKMWKTKGGVYVVALLMLFMILFINANPSRATSIVLKMSSNNSAGSGCSSIHDCPVADHQSLEFLLGPEMDTAPPVTFNTIKVPSPPVANCGEVKNYKCLPNPFNSKINEHCANKLYLDQNRGC